MAHINSGSEVIIERNAQAVAIVRPTTVQPGRLLSECIALAEARGATATIDEEFARDVLAAIEAHREPLDPPAWD